MFIRLLIYSLVFSLMFVSAAVAQTVRTTSELNAALAAASGGDVISLAAGNYGAINIQNRSFSNFVTIRAQGDQSSVVLASIDVENSSYLRLENLTVRAESREGVGVFSNSDHIEILNLRIFGASQFDRDAPNYTQVSNLYGVNVQNATNVLVQNVSVTDVKSSAFLFVNMNDSRVIGNQCNWVASDCYKLATVDNLLFQNNFGARQIHASPTAHVDFVQGQGDVSNSRFIGNVALAANRSFQGLFFDDATYTNLVFENNVIHTSSIRGISVSGSDSRGIEARFNTVLRPAGSQKASLILLPSGSVSENNIVSNNVAKNRDRFRSNVTAQWDDDDDIAHYSLYYQNVMKLSGVTINDFKPVPGSLADGQYGAFARINQLIDGSSEPTPDDPNTPISDNNKFLIAPLLLLSED